MSPNPTEKQPVAKLPLVRTASISELVSRMMEGSQQALARLITMVETDSGEVPEIMRQIYPKTGKAFRIGFTGPPGSGKSTLVDKVTSIFRKNGLTVGIVAVDPTSPFSGGAVLGDRIRMQQHYLDDGVFIRSMATRGSLGGLPKTIRNVMKLVDAFGKDVILVETVGVGQTELDIMEAVDTIVVVLVPEAGDTIQTMKAGLLEIADIFAVNKADREGANYLVAELQAMLRQSPKKEEWHVSVFPTQAINDIGTEELYSCLKQHREYLEKSNKLLQQRQEQRKKEFMETVERIVAGRLWELIEKDGHLMSYIQKVGQGEIDPYTASREVLSERALIETWLKELGSSL